MSLGYYLCNLCTSESIVLRFWEEVTGNPLAKSLYCNGYLMEFLALADLARNTMYCCFASMSCLSSKLVYLW